MAHLATGMRGPVAEAQESWRITENRATSGAWFGHPGSKGKPREVQFEDVLLYVCWSRSKLLDAGPVGHGQVTSTEKAGPWAGSGKFQNCCAPHKIRRRHQIQVAWVARDTRAGSPSKGKESCGLRSRVFGPRAARDAR